MGEMEDRGYVRMSPETATFAFYKNPNDGSEWVNLRWLADVIRNYDAGGVRLTRPSPTVELAARRDLETLRPAVQKTDDDRVRRGRC